MYIYIYNIFIYLFIYLYIKNDRPLFTYPHPPFCTWFVLTNESIIERNKEEISRSSARRNFFPFSSFLYSSPRCSFRLNKTIKKEESYPLIDRISGGETFRVRRAETQNPCKRVASFLCTRSDKKKIKYGIAKLFPNGHVEKRREGGRRRSMNLMVTTVSTYNLLYSNRDQIQRLPPCVQNIFSRYFRAIVRFPFIKHTSTKLLQLCRRKRRDRKREREKETHF